MLNSSIRYENDVLYCDSVPVTEIVDSCGTPVYVYSSRRILENYDRVAAAFSPLKAHLHYSAKANANLKVLQTLIRRGAGIDAVSAGEIYRALEAGAKPENIVFAGVGKSPDELAYALGKGVGWFNVENVAECRLLDDIAARIGRDDVRVALRLNPEVTASTHPYIATGHGGAKFGLTAEAIKSLLNSQADYSHLCFVGIHIHIGSQLGDTSATVEAVRAALELIRPYPQIRTVNIGGGLPVAYSPDDAKPAYEEFAAVLAPLLADYDVLLEPGRSIVADAGMLVCEVLYVKQQAGQTFLIVDGSMAELLRPALYQAYHEIIPVRRMKERPLQLVNVVGPVCETADVLGREVLLPELQAGDLLAVLTCGAYGMVMASNYNARPRPPEVLVDGVGDNWELARKRETWEDLLRAERD